MAESSPAFSCLTQQNPDCGLRFGLSAAISPPSRGRHVARWTSWRTGLRKLTADRARRATRPHSTQLPPVETEPEHFTLFLPASKRILTTTPTAPFGRQT